VAGWALLAPLLGDMSSLSFSWIGMVLALNYGLVILVAGGFHLFFYTLRRQGDDRKYVRQFGHRGGARFTFGRQVHDNMFWSLASGVPVWTGYEVLLLWMHANGWSPGLSFGASPVMFLLLILAAGPWVAFHFYWGHRLLHTGPLYRHVHSLHHRNVNIGPWSGISMHPVEHLIYFSLLLIHLIVPSNPVLVMFHGYMLALSAIFGHTGFHDLLLGKSRRMMVGHFHHQLHHRYFECNYGSVDFPLDAWFGTFHDGSVAARQRLKERLGPR
jgi:lathosterol oxidase